MCRRGIAASYRAANRMAFRRTPSPAPCYPPGVTSDPAETRPDPAADPGPPEAGLQDDGRQDDGRQDYDRSADGPPVDATALLRMAIGFYGIVVVFALGYALISGGLGTLLGAEPPTLPALVGGLGLGLALVLLSRVGARAWPPMLRMSEALADLIASGAIS